MVFRAASGSHSLLNENEKLRLTENAFYRRITRWMTEIWVDTSVIHLPCKVSVQSVTAGLKGDFLNRNRYRSNDIFRDKHIKLHQITARWYGTRPEQTAIFFHQLIRCCWIWLHLQQNLFQTRFWRFCLSSGLGVFTYQDKTCVCVCAPLKNCICRGGSSSDTKGEKQHRLRVNSKTKTWVSTSGDRGGRAQAVKLWEVFFGRTIGWIEEAEATWKGTMQTHKDTHTRAHTQADGNRQHRCEWAWTFWQTNRDETNKRVNTCRCP